MKAWQHHAHMVLAHGDLDHEKHEWAHLAQIDADQNELYIVPQGYQPVAGIERQLLTGIRLDWETILSQLNERLLQIEALDQRAEGLR